VNRGRIFRLRRLRGLSLYPSIHGPFTAYSLSHCLSIAYSLSVHSSTLSTPLNLVILLFTCTSLYMHYPTSVLGLEWPLHSLTIASLIRLLLHLCSSLLHSPISALTYPVTSLTHSLPSQRFTPSSHCSHSPTSSLYSLTHCFQGTVRGCP
jgi:hypothetical protein